MDKAEFISKIVDKKYVWQEGILIKKGDFKPIFVSYEGLEQMDEGEFNKAVPDVEHMTRIVGYYSKVHNWNPSKVAELKDRQTGQYEIKG